MSQTLQERMYNLGMESKHEEQGIIFLQATKTKMEIVKAIPQKSPIWANEHDHGIHYSIKLSNARGYYKFDFWGSLHDRTMLDIAEQCKTGGGKYALFERLSNFLKKKTGTAPIYSEFSMPRLIELTTKAIEPKPYDILASLYPINESNFEDFCSSMGFDTDSKKAEKIYNACVEQSNNLRRLFTNEQIEALQEIQ